MCSFAAGLVLKACYHFRRSKRTTMQTSYNERERASSPWLSWWQAGVTRALLLWEHPGGAAILAMVVYALLASRRGSLLRVTEYPYFNYLADAFLHGQLHLRLRPTLTRDLSVFGGQLYLYWPPFPAVVLLPFVALFGVHFSDVLATIGLGGLNVALVALLLRRANERAVINLDPIRRALLVLFFGLGTVNITLAPYGRVWFVAQLIAFGCVACSYLAALSLRKTPAFFLAGVAVAAALLTRNHLVLGGLWPAWYLLYEHRLEGWRRIAGYIMWGSVPVVVAVALFGLYNWLRFGSPLDNGLAYHRMANIFVRDYQLYGAFNLYYLPTNLFYQFVAYPLPFRPKSTFGGSLFLLSPVFFGAIWAMVRGHQRLSNWMLVMTVLLVAIPILLLMGTGWVQWGPRYTLDYTVPLLLLTAAGVRRWPVWLLGLLTAVSIIHYIVGTIFLAQFV